MLDNLLYSLGNWINSPYVLYYLVFMGLQALDGLIRLSAWYLILIEKFAYATIFLLVVQTLFKRF